MFLAISILSFFLLALPLMQSVLYGNGLDRVKAVSVTTLKMPWSMQASHVVSAYFNHLSLTFLFMSGDIDFPGQFITRHSIRDLGQLYLIQLPFILIGLLCTLRKWRSPNQLAVITLLLLYPLPGALTANINPYATRSIVGILPLQILTAIGFVGTVTYMRQKSRTLTIIIGSVIAASVAVSSLSFFQAWQRYPLYAADFWGWQYGARETMTYFLTHNNRYDELYLTDAFNSPNSFISFYDPENQCGGKCRIGRFNRFDESKKQLFAVSPNDREELEKQSIKMNVLHVVQYPNTQPAFYIGTLTRNLGVH